MMRISGVILAAALAIAGCKKGGDQPADNAGAASGDSKASASGSGSTAASGTASATPTTPPPEGCNSDLKQRPSADTTFTKACSPYTLQNDLSVDGWDLTIEPGVELRFGGNAGLYVGNSSKGRITARGTAEAPIRFTSAGRKEKSFWRGLVIGNEGDGSTLEHVILEYAGSNDSPPINIHDTQVTLKNVTITESSGPLVRQGQAEAVVTITDSDFSGARDVETAAELSVASAAALQNVKWPEKSEIALHGRVKESLALTAQSIPYRVTNDLSVEGEGDGKTGSLKLGPGVVLKFGENQGLYVGSSYPGSLKANGTAEKPVIFTSISTEEAKGSWRGLMFQSLGKGIVLDHVRVENAGETEGAAIRYHDIALGSITNTTIKGSKGFGIRAYDAQQRWDKFDQNTFEDIDGAVLSVSAAALHNLGTANKFPEGAHIEVHGSVHQDTTWTAQPIPYVMATDLSVESRADGKTATLTLQPGALVKFPENQSFYVGSSYPGALVATGTAEKPITFTAVNGSWRGLRAQTQGKLTLENAVIEKVDEEHFALEVYDRVQGSVKAVTFREAPKALKKCSKKLTTEKLELSGGEVNEDC